MTADEILRDCLVDLEAATLQARRALEQAAELRTATRYIEQAVDEAQHQVANATLNPNGALGQRYIASATQHCETIRRRTVVASNLAARIEERLDAARVRVFQAQEKDDRLARDPHLSHLPAMERAFLHAAINYLSHLIDLSTPLARSARVNLERTAHTAAALVDPEVREELRDFTVFQVDRGIQSTALTFERADEASEHLERVVERTASQATGTLARAEYLTEGLPPPSHRSVAAFTLKPSGPSR